MNADVSSPAKGPSKATQRARQKRVDDYGELLRRSSRMVCHLPRSQYRSARAAAAAAECLGWIVGGAEDWDFFQALLLVRIVDLFQGTAHDAIAKTIGAYVDSLGLPQHLTKRETPTTATAPATPAIVFDFAAERARRR